MLRSDDYPNIGGQMNLFPGERIDFSEPDNNSSQFTDEEINQKYVKGDVRIVTEQARYPLDSIPGMVKSNKYELNPEFQRRYRWSTERQSRLIESFIMNVPIPPIFLYEDKFSHYEVMDGLQRMTAISEFYSDNFVLEGLVEWKELNGKKYSQLPEQVKNGIDRRYLSSIILLQETAKSESEAQRLKQIVFERINSGGEDLRPQETRNAIFNGPLNRLCIRLARNKYLCKLWDIPEPTPEEISDDKNISSDLIANESYRKMIDVELVLRFFALRQRIENRKGSFEAYLDNYLKHGNHFPNEVLTQLEGLFNSTIQIVFEILGEQAFRLWRLRRNGGWGWFDRPAMTAYDPIMHVFSLYANDFHKITSHKDEIRDKLTDFYEQNYESFGGRNTTNISNIVQRNTLFEGFIKNILGV